MSTNARIEAFIRQEVQWYTDELVSRGGTELQRRGLVLDGTLLRSLAGQVVGGATSAISFPLYGRFVDMGARRGFHKGRYTGRARRTEGLRPPKKNPWYSRQKMGLLGQLTSNLVNKYVDTIAYEARDQMANP